MRTIFLYGTCLLLLAACGNDDDSGNTLLARPPYDKLTDSLRQRPQDAALHYRRGVLLYRNGQLAAAEADLRTAWNIDHQEAYAISMITLLREKNTDSAIAFIQGALKQLPASIALQVNLARGYQQKKETDKALQLCNELLAQYPGELDALVMKSELLKEQRKDAEALAVLEQAYIYAPGDVDLVHNLAFSYAEANNPKVLPLADSLIRADVGNRHAEPYFFKGVYYSNIGRNDEAVRQFDAAIQHDFNYQAAYINKGIVYYDQKKYPQALQTFNLATTVFPDQGEPYLWLARTQEAMGNKDEAQLNYQRAYGLDKSLKDEK